MLEGTKQWLDRNGDKFETLWWFPQGGGFGLTDIADEGEIMRVMAEHPFTPYCDVEVQICVDPHTGLEAFRQAMQQQMAIAGAGNGAP
jgi:hypothetical protein